MSSKLELVRHHKQVAASSCECLRGEGLIIIIIINESHCYAILRKTTGPLKSTSSRDCYCCYTSPWDRWNNSAFIACLNASRDSSDVTDFGKLFQTVAAATGNARSPMVACDDHGTWSDTVDAERAACVSPCRQRA